VQNLLKIAEFIPAIAFITSYIAYDMLIATKVLIISSLFIFIFISICSKKIDRMQLMVLLVVCVLGSFTLISKNTSFIKMKPTFIYGSSAIILLIGLAFKKIFIKKILGQFLEMSETYWKRLTLAWVVFLAAYAILNEVIWRNFSDETWVAFKFFSFIPLSMTFLGAQLYILRKHIAIKE
jgi:intracellular septation protein